MIRFEQASKRFGKVTVLDRVDLHVPRGQRVVVIGPSGSGKSTLLRCINRLENLSAGRLIVDGCDLSDPHTDINRLRADVGMVFQAFNLFPHLTALQNIALAPVKVRKVPRPDAESLARELLTRVGLAHKADAYPRQLSGGQQQRVAIARGLAMRPKALLFDEPTSALDPEMIGEVLEVMTDLAQGHLTGGTPPTLVVVTHEMGFARRVADRVLFMDHGQVVEDASPEAFFGAPTTVRAQSFLASIRH